MRIELPKDAWAELRDPEDVTERQRKPLIAAMDAARKDQPAPPDLVEKAREGDREALAALGAMSSMSETLEVVDAAVIALVASWSYPAEISADGLLDLPARALDVLRDAISPLFDQLMPQFGPTKGMAAAVGEDGKPSALPFGPSSDSRAGVGAAAQ